MKLATFLVCIFLIHNFSGSVGSSLKWSSNSYTLKAILTVPAANITEPYQVWVNGDTGKSRVDFYDGMDKLYKDCSGGTKNCKYYKIHPITTMSMVKKEVCSEMYATAPEIKMYALNTYLPDKRWTYVGIEKVNNVEARKFVFEYSAKYETANPKVIYTVWVNIKKPIPVRFLYELKEGSKLLDNFRHDYIHFDDSKPDDAVIEKPSGMKCTLLYVKSPHMPIDPLAEFIDPDLEHSRVKNVFERFKMKHNKRYTNEDERFKRMNIFKDNLRFINSFNRRHKSWSLGVNHLADFSKEEMLVFMGTIVENGVVDSSGDNDDDDDEKDNINLQGSEAHFDWREYGAVTPIKDQTPICQGCYAFTTAAAVESSAYASRGCKHLEEASEQAILDCSWGEGNEMGNLGCSGGTYEVALQWIKKYGLPLRSDYGPYLAMEGICHAMEMGKLVRIKDYKHVQKKKREIKETLRKNGPLLASVDASPQSFLFYTSGVYDEPECSSDANKRNHGVAIVGYGRHFDIEKQEGAEHWIIKNSYGKDWGEDGYMRLAARNNRCGLKNYAYTVNFNENKSDLCKRLK